MASDKENEMSDVETWEEKVEETGEERSVTSDEIADAFWEQYLKGAAEDKAVNMAQHMKQYHPHGFTENSTCKYYPNLNKNKCREKSEGASQTTSTQKGNETEGASLDALKLKLWNDFGVASIFASSKEDLKQANFAWFDRVDFCTRGNPISPSEQRASTEKFYEVCRQIKSRHPKFMLDLPFFVPWSFDEINGAGRSSPDRRILRSDQDFCRMHNISLELCKQRECYISVGDLADIGTGYSPNFHTQETFGEDVIRHEIGHNLATREVMTKWLTVKHKLEDLALAKAKDPAKVESIVTNTIAQQISEGAALNDEETMAEIFSIYTHPQYKKGILAPVLEDIAETMLSQHYEGSHSKQFTLDEQKKGVKEIEIPQWWQRALGYNTSIFSTAARPQGEKNLMWFDQWDGKWHVFSDHAEMMRYVLDAYGFEQKDIEQILKGIPNARWDAMLLWNIKNDYSWNKESVDKIIEKYKYLSGGASVDDGTEVRISFRDISAGDTKDSVVEDSAEEVKDIVIFDPEEFDQNSFEWGAIYWINTIRGEVEKFDKGYVIPDEQMIEMLAPLKAAARVYAEAQGQNKAWVKNTVLSVPKAFLNAFDVLSDGEGVTKERFLELFTVEAICALAKGEVNSIHDIEEYYDRKGIYRPRGGYKVGDWVLIEKNAPGGKEDKRRDRDIRRVIALLGDEGKGDVELVFWNAKKTKPIARKASDCSEAFSSYEAASDYKWDDVTTPDEDAESRQKSEEDEVYEALYGAILESMGVTQDAMMPSTPGFWQKHCHQYHPKGFSEKTTCKYLEGEHGNGAQVKKYPQKARAESKGQYPQETMTFDEAQKWLRENGNIDAFHATTEDDLEYMGLHPFALDMMRSGAPMTKEQFEKAVVAVSSVCKDLKERFPDIKFGFDVIYPYELSSQDAGGMSSLDRRTGFGYLTVGDPEKLLSHIGEQDSRIYDLIIRHEIGHSLSSNHISARFDELITPAFVARYGEPKFRDLLKTICNVGTQWLDAKNLYQKSYGKEEIIADSFAVFTAPEYKKGMLPQELETLCAEMIHNPHLSSQHEIWALDGNMGTGPSKNILGYVQGVVEMTALHHPPKDDSRPYALNCLKNRWEFFDTEKERDAWVKEHEKECSKYTMEDARAWMEAQLPKIKAHIRGKNKPKPPTPPEPKKEKGEKRYQDIVADAIEAACGITQDAASEKGAAGFWEEHDRKHHHGHYDPETQTCTLREEARAAEERRSKTDSKIDDLTGGSGNAIISPNKTISKEEDYVRAQGNNLPRREGGEGVGREQPQGGGAHNILAESSAIARGVEGRVQESTRVRDKEAESAARLKEYAKENGLWRDDVEKEFDARYGTEEGQKNTDGGEAIVWFDRDRGVAVKAIGLDYYGSPALALDRVELHNRYFPHAPLSLVGFGEVKDVVGKDGEVELYGRPFNIIAEQPIIDRSKELTKDEIRERLEAQGFRFVADRGDSGIDMVTPDGKAVVSDLHERNVFGTEGGGVAVIDCDIRRKGGLAGENNPTKRNVGVTDEEEAEYLDAVLRGDVESCEKMVAQAARNAGYTVSAWHYGELGMFPESSYNEPQMPLHVGTRKAAIDRLMNRANSGAYEWAGYKLFGEDGNWRWQFKSEFYPTEAEAEKDMTQGGPFTTREEAESDMAKDYGGALTRVFVNPDGMLVSEEDDPDITGVPVVKYRNAKEDKGNYSYKIYDASRIRSGEAILKNDKGRVIPLSKRFDDGDDIRGDVTSGIDIDKLREYKALMEKKKPGGDAMKALVKIGRMKAPEAMEKAFREMLGNSGTRHTYGVPYQGSKSRTAKSIVDRLPKGKRFVDLFSGGGAVTHAAMESSKYEKYRMNDLDGKGQRLFLEGVQGKWDDYARKSMTEEEFSAIKGTPESLPWSFNGLGRNLARPSNGRDHAAEQIRRVKALSSLKEQSNNIESSETDYSEVELKPGDVVYADIPYESTDQRGYGIGGGFDKAKFIKWAQRQRFPVYVSEYAMPEGWTEVASFDVRGMRGGGKKEKLFVQSKFARKVLTVQDSALYPNDPDFWMKHDRAHHHGHFDPNTQTCTLREQMGLPTAKNKTQRETQQAREDEQIDDLSETSPKANPPSSRTQAKINELANSIASFGGDMDPVKSATLISALPKASRIVKAAQKIKRLSSPKVRRVSAEEFHKAISAAVATRPESDRWRVDIHPIEDYKKDQCFVSDGGSVFALAGEDIVSVCKNRDDKGFSGKGLLEAAVLKGGRKLDSYEGNHAFYARCGFEPVSWTKFNPEYAPDGALPEDIIFYKYTGNKRELDKAGVNKDIFDFKRAVEPMEYDAAGAYRDARLG